MLDVEVLEAIVLGVVQGIAEFLPISSSGHLVIFSELLDRWLGINASNSQKLQLNVTLHVGTLFAILVVYRSDLWQLRRQPRLLVAIILASIPAGVVGIALLDFFKAAFETPLVAALGLIVTAILLLVGQRWERNQQSLEQLSYGSAFAVGVFQALALIPGISRSGSTIAGGLLSGLQREAATTFSFFIAIPAIGGAALLTAKDVLQGEGAGNSAVALIMGGFTSFVVGLFALKWLIRIVSQRKLHWFAYYCLTVAVLTLVWQLSERLGSSG